LYEVLEWTFELRKGRTFGTFMQSVPGVIKYKMRLFAVGSQLGRPWSKAEVSPIKRHLSREKSIPTVRGVSSSPSVVGIGVSETNQ